MRVRNWAGNVRFTPARRVSPASVDELARAIREAARVRVVGAGHSWSDAIVTDGTLISLDRLRGVVALDRDAMQVTVEGGVRLYELNRYLDGHGLALANLGSIDRQSVAGVIATGTHGSGRRFGCLSTQVARLELVDGTGTTRTLRRGEPEFAGAVVGLGALGVVHAVTFDVVPAFRLHDVTGTMPFDDAIAQLDEVLASADHVKLWWLCPGDDAIVYRFRRTEAPANDRPLRSFARERVLSVAVYRSLLAVGHVSGRRWIPAINRFLTAQAGRPVDRTVPSHRGYLTPSPPIHREAEWAFDARDAPALLRAYRRLLPDGGHTYNFIQELRWSAADDLWLSPAYGRDSIWLSLYNIDRARWPAQLAKFEAFARAHGGRPHWGKEATFDHAYLRGQYAQLDAFAALARRYDPERRFHNRWLEAILGV